MWEPVGAASWQSRKRDVNYRMNVFKTLFWICVVGLLGDGLHGQASGNPCTSAQAFHIVVLGSSTAAGTGPSSPDSTWVNRYRRHVQQLNPANLVTNLAVGGFTTYRIMPTGYTPPSGRPSPDVTHNISQALSLNPDAILINMPSNDVSSGFTVAEQLHNFDTIIDLATLAGVPVWVTTTQPKNYSNPAQIAQQIAVRDSLFARYGSHTIDFWTTIATPGGTIDPLYDSGDGTHLNNAAHGILASRVIAKAILDSLFVPAAFPDAAALRLTPVYAPTCGDTASVFRLHLANFGSASGSPVAVGLTWQNLHTSQSGSQSASAAALGTCAPDSVDFVLPTQTAGTYRLRAWSQAAGDLLPANDTATLVLSFLGTPTLLPLHDTACSATALTLGAMADPQDTLFWYDVPVGGSPIAFGPSLLTPLLSTSTTYYAEAVRGDLFFRDSLFTTLTSNVNWNGSMIDLVAHTSLVLDSFDLKINSLGGQTVGLYTKAGSHIGFQTNAAAWTLRGTVPLLVTSSTSWTKVPLGGITMAAGDTLGLYFFLQNSASTLSYQSAAQPLTRSDSQLSILMGSGVSTGFSATFYPRHLNTQVHYHHGSRPGGDCSTGRIPVEAVISLAQVSLPADTILDIAASLLVSAGPGFAHYQWSTGDSGQQVLLSAASLGTGIHIIQLTATDSLGCTATDEMIVGVAYLLGVEPGAETRPVLHPQPASDWLALRWAEEPGPGTLLLRDLQGRTRISMPFEGDARSTRLHLMALPAGCYTLEWQSENVRWMRPVLIVR